jgi:zinc protease
VRGVILSDIKSHWDSPSDFAGDIVRQSMYKGHPYSKSRLGTEDVIKRITRKELVDFYRQAITPQGARLSVVGDFNNYDLRQMLQDTVGSWQGKGVKEPTYPALGPVTYSEVKYKINRDQVVLVFAGRSVDRKNKDYDKLLIFDQILSGGVLGSMSSRLFQLREQTGLFYTIGGSTLYHSDEQPGMIFIKTIVSLDRLAEAEKAIKNSIDTIVDSLTQDEFESARNAIINSMVDNFETDRSMAATFLSMARFNMPPTYFDTRAQDFEKITLAEVKEAAKKIVDSKKMMIFKIGRV